MFSLDDFADEYHTTVVAPRETARAAIDAEFAAAIAAIESDRAAKYAAAGIDVAASKTRASSTRATITNPVKSGGKLHLNDAGILKAFVANYHTPGRKNHAYFAAIENSRTVRDAIDAGVPRHHLRYEINHGFIVVE